MSKKTKKDAPNAETRKPENVETEKPGGAETTVTAPGPVSIDSVFSSVDPGKIKTAEDLGFPIGKLLQWAKGVDEERAQTRAYLTDIVQGMTKIPSVEAIAESLKQKLVKEAEDARAKAVAMAQQGPQGQQQRGESVGEIASFIKSLVGEGAGSPGGSVGDKYFMSLGYESASLSQFFQKEMMKQMLPKAFEEFQKGFKNPFSPEVTK